MMALLRHALNQNEESLRIMPEMYYFYDRYLIQRMKIVLANIEFDFHT